MATWAEIQAIITRYDREKAWSYRLLGMQSDYIRRLSNQSQGHLPKEQVSQPDRLMMLQAAYDWRAGYAETLSSRFAWEVIGLCTGDPAHSFSSVWHELHTRGLLSNTLLAGVLQDKATYQPFMLALQRASPATCFRTSLEELPPPT